MTFYRMATPAAEATTDILEAAAKQFDDLASGFVTDGMVELLFYPEPFGQYRYVGRFTPGGGAVETSLGEPKTDGQAPWAWRQHPSEVFHTAEFPGEPLKLREFYANDRFEDPVSVETKDRYVVRTVRMGLPFYDPIERQHADELRELLR